MGNSPDRQLLGRQAFRRRQERPLEQTANLRGTRRHRRNLENKIARVADERAYLRCDYFTPQIDRRFSDVERTWSEIRFYQSLPGKLVGRSESDRIRVGSAEDGHSG